MAISKAKRLAAARVLGAWRRQSKDKRPTHAALAKKLQITPSTLRYIASKCLRRQKEVILERDRIETQVKPHCIQGVFCEERAALSKTRPLSTTTVNDDS